MTDFLSTSIWIFDFMVLGLLPFVSVLLACINLYGIAKDAPKTITRSIYKSTRHIRRR